LTRIAVNSQKNKSPKKIYIQKNKKTKKQKIKKKNRRNILINTPVLKQKNNKKTQKIKK